ncbi:hypothetical protein [Actinomadura terrae]|uniref:hypothetical protein n=1 Tax=Actinomadura terrae TaxID=604353 RepID=UPI001FA7D33E|nr:hypothetical protein [Actinomadura terrae]
MKRRWAGEAGATLRQWRWPREFRIQQAQWPDDILAAFTHLTGLRGAEERPGVGMAGPEERPGVAPEEVAGLGGRSLADVATSVWRLHVRTASLPDGMRSTTRQVEKAWDTLVQAGVEIKDHLNEPFDSGLSISVVAFQPTPGLERERVIETIRPSVYFGDQRIQMAEVIVGTPESADQRPREEAREQRP